ncbi:amidohydrolase family protein [Streptomyces sp. NPDC020983]|uniref:amidohydrolase family protein n=1 Tax=Streptomyces sp. NPDC020983 TaxID=3365106 RepID=UPI0037880B73
MKIITLEEHFAHPALTAASSPAINLLAPDFAATYAPGSGFAGSLQSEAVLLDVGEKRIADMDRNGITTQVLSCLWAQQAPADVAPALVHAANDTAAEAVRAFPGRFAAFAALPTAAPEAAARELDRCVTELGFVGTLINGRTEGEFLDAPRFDPVLATAGRLGVPVYLHPSMPPRAVTEASYGGLSPLVTGRLQTAAWGWHVETAEHFIHMVLSGVFDRYPDLQIILGHWGEMIPFYLDRIEELLPQGITKLDRPFADYVRHNVHITPSGMWNQAQLRFCVETLGADRIVLAVDYPFVGNEGAAAFLEEADLSAEDKNRIAHGTAERLLGL